jgi:hypothetical protein
MISATLLLSPHTPWKSVAVGRHVYTGKNGELVLKGPARMRIGHITEVHHHSRQVTIKVSCPVTIDFPDGTRHTVQ